jgi:hypothetical protein
MSAPSSTIQQISAGAGHLLIFGPLGLAAGLVALLAMMCLVLRLAGVSRAHCAHFALSACYAIMARLTKRLEVPPDLVLPSPGNATEESKDLSRSDE